MTNPFSGTYVVFGGTGVLLTIVWVRLDLSRGIARPLVDAVARS